MLCVVLYCTYCIVRTVSFTNPTVQDSLSPGLTSFPPTFPAPFRRRHSTTLSCGVYYEVYYEVLCLHHKHMPPCPHVLMSPPGRAALQTSRRSRQSISAARRLQAGRAPHGFVSIRYIIMRCTIPQRCYMALSVQRRSSRGSPLDGRFSSFLRSTTPPDSLLGMLTTPKLPQVIYSCRFRLPPRIVYCFSDSSHLDSARSHRVL